MFSFIETAPLTDDASGPQLKLFVNKQQAGATGTKNNIPITPAEAGVQLELNERRV